MVLKMKTKFEYHTGVAGFFTFLALVGGVAVSTAIASETTEQQPENAEPLYEVVEGKVDKGTYNGFRRFHGTCHACHGQDALGSSFAPSLVDSLKSIDYETFKTTVLEGRQSKDASGGVSAMPAFQADNNIKKHLDDIYRYLKARSDGALGPGRPQKQKKK